MRFHLSTGSLYFYPLATVLRWARGAGFDGLELVVNPEAIARGGRAVRRLAEAEAIPIWSVHPTVAPIPGWRERSGGMERTIGLAREVGARLVVMHTPRVPSLEQGQGLAFRQRVEDWQARLAGSGLQLAMENKAARTTADWDYVLTPLGRLRAFADRHDLGLVLDTTHAGSAGEDLLVARRLFDGRLAEVHLSDLGGRLALGSLPPVHHWLGEHRFPGAGDLALAELLGALTRDGYEGPIVLELNPAALRFWWPPAIRRRLAEAMAWLREAVSDSSTR